MKNTMSNLLNLTSAQLIKAANIKDRIEALTKELNGLLGSTAPAIKAAKPAKKRGMSAAGRAAVSAAAKLRWAKINAAKAKPAVVKAAVKAVVAAKPALKPAKKKFVMSAAAKAKISAAAKARWAKIKAAKK